MGSVAHLLAEQLDLLGFGDVQLTELGLQVAVVLQLEQGLGDGQFELVRLRVSLLDDFGLRGNRHLPGHEKGVLLLNSFHPIESDDRQPGKGNGLADTAGRRPK